jgi:hypothetical protein
MVSKKLVVLVVLNVLAISPMVYSQQQAERPVRNGFTLELGIGASLMQTLPEVGDTQNEFGLAPLSLSLGGFINESMAIMFRMSGTSYFTDNAVGDSSQVLNGFYGIHFQYWLNDQIFVSGGPGFALVGMNPLLKSDYDPDPETGFGLSFRAGYSFFNLENHSLRLSLELFSSFLDNANVIGEAINFEWQWF